MNFLDKDSSNWKRSARGTKPYDAAHRNQPQTLSSQSEYRPQGAHHGRPHNYSQQYPSKSSATKMSPDTTHSADSFAPGTNYGLSLEETNCKTFRVDAKQYEKESLMATWNIQGKIGHYSLDENYVVRWDASGMKFFAPEKCSHSVNLFDGFNEDAYDQEQLKRDQYNRSYSISQLINWMKRNEERIATKPHFVIKHDFLKKIIMSTCENRRSWEMEAVKHDGVIYLSKLRADETGNMYGSNPLANRRRKEASYGGLMFEKHITRKASVDETNDKFYAVLLGSLQQASQSQWRKHAPNGALNFLVSAEIDAIVGNEAQACENMQNYVEIKTTLHPRGKPGTKRRFGFLKLLDWWNHCYLAGIPRIFIGIRNPVGALEETILSSASDIPGVEVVHRSQQPCMDFFLAFFTWVKDVVENEGTVYEFSFYPQNSYMIKCREVKQPDHPFLMLFKEKSLIFF